MGTKWATLSARSIKHREFTHGLTFTSYALSTLKKITLINQIFILPGKVILKVNLKTKNTQENQKQGSK
jgi:hypothetical protein